MNGANELMLYVFGLTIFYAIHLIPFNQGFRDQVVTKLGEKLYRAVFACITLLGLVMLVSGWNDFSNIYFYEPPVVLKQLNLAIMLPVMYLWIAAEVPNNIKRFIKNPMLLGMKLWAAGHLLANGDLRSMILFLSFMVFSIVATVFANRKNKEVVYTPRPVGYDLGVLTISLLAYVAIVYFHGYLFDMPIIQYFFAV